MGLGKQVRLRGGIGGAMQTLRALDFIADLAQQMSEECPGAPLILSGIIAERAGDVRISAEKNGFVFVRELTENDWVALEFQRR